MSSNLYRWNEKKEPRRFWNTDASREMFDLDSVATLSDKDAISNARVTGVIGSVCRVLTELMEVEERRNRDSEPSSSNPPPDEL